MQKLNLKVFGLLFFSVPYLTWKRGPGSPGTALKPAGRVGSWYFRRQVPEGGANFYFWRSRGVNGLAANWNDHPTKMPYEGYDTTSFWCQRYREGGRKDAKESISQRDAKTELRKKGMYLVHWSGGINTAVSMKDLRNLVAYYTIEPDPTEWTYNWNIFYFPILF